jgi:hypothetical protein
VSGQDKRKQKVKGLYEYDNKSRINYDANECFVSLFPHQIHITIKEFITNVSRITKNYEIKNVYHYEDFAYGTHGMILRISMSLPSS